MRKIEREQKEKETFQMFCGGHSLQEIARETGVSDTTISRWKKRYNWGDKKKEIDKKVQEKLVESVADMRGRHIRIIKFAIDKWVRDIYNQLDVKVTTSDLIGLIKLESEYRENEEEIMPVTKEIFEINRELAEKYIDTFKKRDEEILRIKNILESKIGEKLSIEIIEKIEDEISSFNKISRIVPMRNKDGIIERIINILKGLNELD
ncbi:MAG: helix-turn-helix domain-containing protein [archaeon]